MRKERIHTVLKWFLVTIFLSYLCSITFFTHTHIINGVTIVHSHMYATGDNETASHEHTTSEIQLIHTLSTFTCFATILILLFLISYHPKIKNIPIREYIFRKQKSYGGISRLRPPPACIA